MKSYLYDRHASTSWATCLENMAHTSELQVPPNKQKDQ